MWAFTGALLPAASWAQSTAQVIRLAPDLEIREVIPKAFVVTHSYPWPANSLFVLVGDRHLVFIDTPYTPEATACVLDWIAETFGERSMLTINTGFHFDNLGGNRAFVERDIPVLGSDRTADLILERGEEARQLFLQLLSAPEDRRYHDHYASLRYVAPTRTFPLREGSTLTIEGERIEVIFPGETHSPDNIVVHFPNRGLLFGGCMMLAGDKVGNTADANMDTWAAAVLKLQALDCRVVVPGHGLRFDPGLIQNTVRLLQ